MEKDERVVKTALMIVKRGDRAWRKDERVVKTALMIVKRGDRAWRRMREL